jgi:hypothetical protein
MLLMMSIFYLPQLIRFDFRGDVDRMDVLKSLPISSSAAVIGELIVPIALTTILQMSLFAAVGLTQHGLSLYLYAAAAFVAPVNLLVFGLENLVFLLYPYRMIVPGSVDVQVFGHQMLVTFLKFIVLIVMAAGAAGIGGIVYLATGGSMLAFAIGSWFGATALAVLLVPAIAAAYSQYEPGTDTPP